ncbi:hypothetical protein DV702_11565 [Sporosarcina sp. PTS2304]|nr:hypothetical protein DV702_11565 [Sporosarcina sp. PTS2304]
MNVVRLTWNVMRLALPDDTLSGGDAADPQALRVTPVVFDPPGVDRLPAPAVLCVQDSLITLCRGENQVELSDTMRPLLKVDSGEVLSATMIVSMN